MESSLNATDPTIEEIEKRLADVADGIARDLATHNCPNCDGHGWTIGCDYNRPDEPIQEQCPYCFSDGGVVVDKAEFEMYREKLRELEVVALSRDTAHSAEIARLRGALPQWIDVRDRLPEDVPSDGSIPFLVYPYFEKLLWHSGMFWEFDDMLEDYRPAMFVTHWMPLPEPPKGDTTNA